MILLADGGSTKIEWNVVDNGKVLKKIFTKGANPFFRTSEEISSELTKMLVPELEGYAICTVYFYGAGCINAEKCDVIRSAVELSLGKLPVEVGSDLLGAAKSLCGDNAGIACILGTGSNSCFYDGKEIVENVSPLGYILGDEGSGAVLGRLFLGDCLKNQFGKEMRDELLTELGLTPAEILEKVYREDLPNRFLAQLTPFIKQHLEHYKVHELVQKSFEDFFRKNVMQYECKKCDVYFTGSIAYHFQEVLFQAAEKFDIKIKSICQSPMDGLIRHYSQKRKETAL